MHDDDRLVIVDFGQPLQQALGQIEILAVPVARKVFGAALDVAVGRDDSRTADPNEWGETELLFLRAYNKVRKHVGETIDGVVALDILLIDMAPFFGSPDRGFGDVSAFAKGHDTDADIGAADVGRQDGVMAGEDPAGRKVY